MYNNKIIHYFQMYNKFKDVQKDDGEWIILSHIQSVL